MGKDDKNNIKDDLTESLAHEERQITIDFFNLFKMQKKLISLGMTSQLLKAEENLSKAETDSELEKYESYLKSLNLRHNVINKIFEGFESAFKEHNGENEEMDDSTIALVTQVMKNLLYTPYYDLSLQEEDYINKIVCDIDDVQDEFKDQEILGSE